MQARMKHPALVLPDARNAMLAFHATTDVDGLPLVTRELVNLRASQINGCSVCVDMHSRALKEAGQTDERIWAVGAWRETSWFTDAERAALALTEELTRLSDRGEVVPDALWDDVVRHYDERARAALLLSIAGINVWNRLNVGVRQIAGAKWE
jgi:AhpD family alkylhydroperoxidase